MLGVTTLRDCAFREEVQTNRRGIQDSGENELRCVGHTVYDFELLMSWVIFARLVPYAVRTRLYKK